MASSRPGSFKSLYLDPPWPERGGGKIKRGADRHYPLVAVRDMPRVILQSPLYHPADEAMMWMWTTNTFLPDALRLIPVLGFRYITNTAWVKVIDQLAMDRLELDQEQVKTGLGQYQRGAHELLLFAVRGKVKVPAPKDRLPSVVFAPRGKHSAKPTVFYERIERIGQGPYLEMFARSLRRDWTSWGNEV